MPLALARLRHQHLKVFYNPVVNSNAAVKARTLLGTSAGIAFFSIGGSILAWPTADLFFAPRLVYLGMHCTSSSEKRQQQTSMSPAFLHLAHKHKGTPKMSFIEGGHGVGKQLELVALAEGRPVIYISLREATSVHDLYLAIVSGVYSTERLGFLGTLCLSVGLWWIVLFDLLVSQDTEQTRSLHFSVVLQHLRRSLRCLEKEKGSPTGALIVLDHVSDAAKCANGKGAPRELHAMLRHLLAWCTKNCLDDGLADIAICSESTITTWMFSRSCQMTECHDAQAFHAIVKKLLD